MVVCLHRSTSSPVSTYLTSPLLLLVECKARQAKDNDISYNDKKNSEDLVEQYGR